MSTDAILGTVGTSDAQVGGILGAFSDWVTSSLADLMDRGLASLQPDGKVDFNEVTRIIHQASKNSIIESLTIAGLTIPLQFIPFENLSGLAELLLWSSREPTSGTSTWEDQATQPRRTR